MAASIKARILHTAAADRLGLDSLDIDIVDDLGLWDTAIMSFRIDWDVDDRKNARRSKNVNRGESNLSFDDLWLGG